MKPEQKDKDLSKKMRWSAALLLAGFLLGSLLPSLKWRVQAAPRKAAALDVVINEVAWMGTDASSADEWIELYNPTSSDIDLSNWKLTDNGDINITLSGTIQAGGYYLLERASDTTISDIVADYIYSGVLHDTVEILELWDNSGSPNLIDTANIGGSAWYAGNNGPKASMERISAIADSSTIWADNNGVTVNGQDASSNPLRGTPKRQNSVSYFPLDVIINEVAWAGTVASSDDEWVELYNPNSWPIKLNNWRLVAESGHLDIILSGTIAGNGYFLLERAHDNVVVLSTINGQIYTLGALSDGGEKLRLRAPNGAIIDTANSNGGAWPKGRLSPASSMERMSTAADADNNWVTYDLPTFGNFNITHPKDAAGNYIYGSPGQVNWGYSNPYTATPVATFTPTPTTSLEVIINEVGWGGTESSNAHEWIELHNPGSQPVDLGAGWKLISTNNALNIALTGIIPAGGYFILERITDDVIKNYPADQLFVGSLSNFGAVLRLLAPGGGIVDTANKYSGDWPAGSGSPDYRSMERSGVVADGSSAWFTFDGAASSYTDYEDNPINGSPGEPNWAINVTATPSPIPTRTPIPPTRTPTPYPFQSVVLNEVLPRAGHDWNGDGVVDVNDEYIEIINRGESPINLLNWKLDDEYNRGSDPYRIPSITLQSGGRIAIFGYTSQISLSDGGDTVRLLKSNNQIADVVTYTVIKVADQSWCRFPENGFWNPNCFPTPDEENKLRGSYEGEPQDPVRFACLAPDTVPESISLIECGLLGMSIRDENYWDQDRSVLWLTGQNKRSTWFR